MEGATNNNKSKHHRPRLDELEDLNRASKEELNKLLGGSDQHLAPVKKKKFLDGLLGPSPCEDHVPQ